MLDRFLEAGGTFVDTADVYDDGLSERVLAPWLAQHRDEVVIATKVRIKVSDPPGEGLAPDRIRAACDASLKRLGVDVIDLYQVHAPDPSVPLEETLEALDGLVQAGKVRALGASNYPAWLLAWAVAMQDREGWSPFVSLQPQYSLVAALDRGRAAAVHARRRARRAPVGPARRRVPVRPPPARRRSPRAAGWPGARTTSRRPPHRRAVERNFQVVDAAEAIAAEHGATVPQVAIAWLLGVEGVTAPIIGARTLEHLEDLLGAADARAVGGGARAARGPGAAARDLRPSGCSREQIGLDRLTGPLRAR